MQSLLQNPRVRRAILDELIPDWRTIASDRGTVFEFAWTRATGQERSHAWRWKRYAQALLAGDELLQDAA